MLLIPSLKANGNLTLDAFSFSFEEINAVGDILKMSNIEIVREEIPKDNSGRYGVRYFVLASDVIKFETKLNLKFAGQDSDTQILTDDEFLNADGGQGMSYKCSRIDTPPNDCKTIYANSDKEAIVKCAFAANSNNWLGGVPSRGQCH